VNIKPAHWNSFTHEKCFLCEEWNGNTFFYLNAHFPPFQLPFIQKDVFLLLCDNSHIEWQPFHLPLYVVTDASTDFYYTLAIQSLLILLILPFVLSFFSAMTPSSHSFHFCLKTKESKCDKITDLSFNLPSLRARMKGFPLLMMIQENCDA
jgi:hypothetical protein